MLYLARFALAIPAFAFAACSSSSDSESQTSDDGLPWSLAPSGITHEDRDREVAERSYPAPPEWPKVAKERPSLEAPHPRATPEECWRLFAERWLARGNAHASGPVHRFATNFEDTGAALYARYVERREDGSTKRLAHGLAVASYDESWEARLAQGEIPTGDEPGLVALITYAEGRVSGPQWLNHRSSDRRARGRVKEVLWAEGQQVEEKFGWRENGTLSFHFRGGAEGFGVFWSEEGYETEHLRYREGKVDGLSELYAADGRLVRRGLRNDAGWQGDQDYWADSNDGRYERLRFEAGKLHGYQAFYAPAGWLAVETWYEHGVQEGPFRRLHPNGETRFLAQLRAGKLEGEARSFSEEGELTAVDRYVRGKRNGLSIEYDWLGRELARGPYLEDERHGQWMSYRYGLLGSEPQQRAQLEWRRNERQGPARLFDGAGRVVLSGQFDGDAASGAWTGFLYDPEVARGAEGLRGTGPVDDEGDPQDQWSFVYPEGQTAVLGAYAADGQRTGTWTYSWPSGTKRAEGSYDEDERTGEWSFYRADGSLELFGSYANGQRIGIWRALDERGWLASEERYDDDGELLDSYRRVALDEAPIEGAPRDPRTKNGLFEQRDADGAVLARQRFANDAPRD
jgi:antitoxin component YwqK of YwqJK toxin-antitoxin module